jgi:hypothetical protein
VRQASKQCHEIKGKGGADQRKKDVDLFFERNVIERHHCETEPAFEIQHF